MVVRTMIVEWTLVVGKINGLIGSAGAYDVRIELRVHDEAALLPVDLAEVLLARTACVCARRVHLGGW